jgi:hypothetical protein
MNYSRKLNQPTNQLTGYSQQSVSRADSDQILRGQKEGSL